MHTHLRRLTALAAVTLMPLASGADIALAQGATQASFELRPYCASLSEGTEDLGAGGGFAGDIPDIPGIVNPADEGTWSAAGPGNCSAFQIQSPSMQKTPKLRNGDVLDLHLVLNNPQRLPVSRIRSWLVYDPSVLRGDLLELSDALPVPAQGETEFANQDGYAKIGASAASGTEPTDDPIVVARLKFTVIATPYASTVISFYDPQGTEDGHTYALTTNGGQDILAPAVPSLLVELDQTAVTPPVESSAASSAPASSVASSSSEAVSSAESVPSSEAASSLAPSSAPAVETSSSFAPLLPSPTFSLLQPQNLRVTTEGGAVYLAWDPLPSAELAGYNIYYGTISGNYLQKRSVDRSATNLTLRGLPEGQPYFFALRGDNGKGEETQFSQEVAVTVGSPATSTAPLSASVFTTPGPQGVPPPTSGQIGGETGLPSPLMLLVFGSAGIGTMLAFRRQWTASAKLSA